MSNGATFGVVDLSNITAAACGDPKMKKESSREFYSRGSQLTAATCIDRRTIIPDRSGRKLRRLCKSSLAAKAQYAANAAVILESVKVHVASRKSGTNDITCVSTER